MWSAHWTCWDLPNELEQGLWLLLFFYSDMPLSFSFSQYCKFTSGFCSHLLQRCTEILLFILRLRAIGETWIQLVCFSSYHWKQMLYTYTWVTFNSWRWVYYIVFKMQRTMCCNMILWSLPLYEVSSYNEAYTMICYELCLVLVICTKSLNNCILLY